MNEIKVQLINSLILLELKDSVFDSPGKFKWTVDKSSLIGTIQTHGLHSIMSLVESQL